MIRKVQRGGNESTTDSANRTNTSENGVYYMGSGKAIEDSNAYYSEILARFNDGNMTLEELYSYLANGLSGNNMTTEQREDFLKQMIDSMLAKRQLDEQRAYDNPLAQLQRLMATGMSKDAALQAIQGGSAGGSSGGSPLIGSAQSPAPSESYANEVQAKTAIANTAFSALSCAANLASFGVSIPGTIANNTIAQVSADVTKSAQTALVGVQTGINALDTALAAGDISKEDYDSAVQSKNGIVRALDTVASKNPDSLAAQFVQSDDFKELVNNPYSDKMASEHYKQSREGIDYAKSLGHTYALQLGQELLNQVNYDVLSETIYEIRNRTNLTRWQSLLAFYDLTELKPVEKQLAQGQFRLNESQTQLNFANVGLTNAQKSFTLGQMGLLKWQKKVLKSQISLNNALGEQASQNANYLYQLGGQIGLQNQINDALVNGFTNGRSNLDIITEKSMQEYQYLNNLYTIYNGTPFQKQLSEYMLNNISWLNNNAWLNMMWSSDINSQYKDYLSDPTSSQNFNRYIRGNNMIVNPPYGGANYNLGGNISLEGLRLNMPGQGFKTPF